VSIGDSGSWYLSCVVSSVRKLLKSPAIESREVAVAAALAFVVAAEVEELVLGVERMLLMAVSDQTRMSTPPSATRELI
jgi:hypothetical protein